MPILDPEKDFADDGGTRSWRANQASWGQKLPPPRIVDVKLHWLDRLRIRQRRAIAFWKNTPTWKLGLYGMFIFGVLPPLFGIYVLLMAWFFTSLR